jgi:hypothetical protein
MKIVLDKKTLSRLALRKPGLWMEFKDEFLDYAGTQLLLTYEGSPVMPKPTPIHVADDDAGFLKKTQYNELALRTWQGNQQMMYSLLQTLTKQCSHAKIHTANVRRNDANGLRAALLTAFEGAPDDITHQTAMKRAREIRADLAKLMVNFKNLVAPHLALPLLVKFDKLNAALRSLDENIAPRNEAGEIDLGVARETLVITPLSIFQMFYQNLPKCFKELRMDITREKITDWDSLRREICILGEDDDDVSTEDDSDSETDTVALKAAAVKAKSATKEELTQSQYTDIMAMIARLSSIGGDSAAANPSQRRSKTNSAGQIIIKGDCNKCGVTGHMGRQCKASQPEIDLFKLSKAQSKSGSARGSQSANVAAATEDVPSSSGSGTWSSAYEFSANVAIATPLPCWSWLRLLVPVLILLAVCTPSLGAATGLNLRGVPHVPYRFASVECVSPVASSAPFSISYCPSVDALGLDYSLPVDDYEPPPDYTGPPIPVAGHCSDTLVTAPVVTYWAGGQNHTGTSVAQGGAPSQRGGSVTHASIGHPPAVACVYADNDLVSVYAKDSVYAGDNDVVSSSLNRSPSVCPTSVHLRRNRFLVPPPPVLSPSSTVRLRGNAPVLSTSPPPSPPTRLRRRMSTSMSAVGAFPWLDIYRITARSPARVSNEKERQRVLAWFIDLQKTLCGLWHSMVHIWLHRHDNDGAGSVASLELWAAYLLCVVLPFGVVACCGVRVACCGVRAVCACVGCGWQLICSCLRLLRRVSYRVVLYVGLPVTIGYDDVQS